MAKIKKGTIVVSIPKESELQKAKRDFWIFLHEIKPTNKSKFGLTDDEIKVLLKERNIDEKDFNKALGTNTCMIVNGQAITYHTDIDRALRLLTNKKK